MAGEPGEGILGIYSNINFLPLTKNREATENGQICQTFLIFSFLASFGFYVHGAKTGEFNNIIITMILSVLQ